MSEFTLSAFADESSRELSVQLDVLKSYGIGYIELRGINGKNVTEHTLEEARLVKKELDSAGVKVSSIGSPIGKTDFSAPFEKTIDLMKHSLDLTQIFETGFIRIFSFYIPEREDFNQYSDEIHRRMRILADMAGEKNVTLVHEHEEGVYGELFERYYDMIHCVNHPNFQGLFDTANFVYAGQVNCPDAFECVKSVIRYVHIKDIADGKYVAPGIGKGQIKTFLRSLLDYGYNGFISLEPHMTAFEGLQHLMRSSDFMPSNSGDGIEKFAVAFNALKKILDEISSEVGRKIYC